MAQDVMIRVRVSTLSRRAKPQVCHDCGTILDLHQPVSDRPGEILGTCPTCGGWHFLGLDADGHPRLVAQLPVGQISNPDNSHS